MMNDIQLTITIDEANLILEALGQQPFVKVFKLIGKIQQQAGQQVNGVGQPDPLAKNENPDDVSIIGE